MSRMVGQIIGSLIENETFLVLVALAVTVPLQFQSRSRSSNSVLISFERKSVSDTKCYQFYGGMQWRHLGGLHFVLCYENVRESSLSAKAFNHQLISYLLSPKALGRLLLNRSPDVDIFTTVSQATMLKRRYLKP